MSNVVARCPICGTRFNEWCTANHLPYAEQQLLKKEKELEQERLEIMQYRKVMNQEV